MVSRERFNFNPSDKQLERMQFERRFWFAKYCASRRYQTAPSGKTWDEVFRTKEGVTLEQFRRQVSEMRKRKKQG